MNSLAGWCFSLIFQNRYRYSYKRKVALYKTLILFLLLLMSLSFSQTTPVPQIFETEIPKDALGKEGEMLKYKHTVCLKNTGKKNSLSTSYNPFADTSLSYLSNVNMFLGKFGYELIRTTKNYSTDGNLTNSTYSLKKNGKQLFDGNLSLSGIRVNSDTTQFDLLGTLPNNEERIGNLFPDFKIHINEWGIHNMKFRKQHSYAVLKDMIFECNIGYEPQSEIAHNTITCNDSIIFNFKTNAVNIYQPDNFFTYDSNWFLEYRFNEKDFIVKNGKQVSNNSVFNYLIINNREFYFEEIDGVFYLIYDGKRLSVTYDTISRKCQSLGTMFNPNFKNGCLSFFAMRNLKHYFVEVVF